MNVQVQTAKREDVPTCFGTPEWDAKAPECAGGLDPKYTHPINGSHVRDACDFFSQCGARSAAARFSRGEIIPASQLRRPPTMPIPLPPAPAPMVPASTFREYMQREVARQQVVAPPVVPSYPYQYAAPPHHPVPQQYQYPAPTYQLQYMVPGYLSVPEQRVHGGSVWGLLAREGLRAALKAIGHQFANYFDTNPFRVPPPPPVQGGPEHK